MWFHNKLISVNCLTPLIKVQLPQTLNMWLTYCFDEPEISATTFTIAKVERFCTACSFIVCELEMDNRLCQRSWHGGHDVTVILWLLWKIMQNQNLPSIYNVAILSKPRISISGGKWLLYLIGCQVYCATDGDITISKSQSESSKNGNFCVFQELDVTLC